MQEKINNDHRARKGNTNRRFNDNERNSLRKRSVFRSSSMARLSSAQPKPRLPIENRTAHAMLWPSKQGTLFQSWGTSIFINKNLHFSCSPTFRSIIINSVMKDLDFITLLVRCNLFLFRVDILSNVTNAPQKKIKRDNQPMQNNLALA